MVDQRIAYQEIRGFKLPAYLPRERFIQATSLTANPGDVFICCYPTTGSTWLQNMVYSILSNDRPLRSTEVVKTVPDVLKDGLDATRRPKAFRYQMPVRFVPHSADAKYIHLTRNPKDTCVSYYNLSKTVEAFGFQTGLFDEFFELFFSGDLPYGSYFDNLVPGYEHLGEPNFLFSTYEEMKRDSKTAILKVARFLGRGLEDRDVEDIDRFCTSQFVKTHELSHVERCMTVEPGFFHVDKHVQTCSRSVSPADIPIIRPKEPVVVRKGEVGQWRFYFSLEQNERMNILFGNETRFTNAENMWPEIMQL